MAVWGNVASSQKSGFSTGIRGSGSCPRKTVVFGRHFLKSTPVSRQAVALGGNPLKKRDRDGWRGGRFIRGNASGRLGGSSQRSWSSLR
jgi:hypothetical protein